jgi:hypothetical protein
MAAAHNKEHEGDTAFNVLSAYDCPYGPGDNRDAWLEGFGGRRKRRSSRPTPRRLRPTTCATSSPRRSQGSAQAQEGPRKLMRPRRNRCDDRTTGTAETALATHVRAGRSDRIGYRADPRHDHRRSGRAHQLQDVMESPMSSLFSKPNIPTPPPVPTIDDAQASMNASDRALRRGRATTALTGDTGLPDLGKTRSPSASAG